MTNMIKYFLILISLPIASFSSEQAYLLLDSPTLVANLIVEVVLLILDWMEQSIQFIKVQGEASSW